MKTIPVITDNIAELLMKIVEFTNCRHKILADNIKNIDSEDFFPLDLAVEEFSSILGSAIAEHCKNNRLLLFDTSSIKFGSCGSISATAEVDMASKELLERDRDEYLEFQLTKLLENTLNQRIARELLCHHQNICSGELSKRTNG